MISFSADIIKKYGVEVSKGTDVVKENDKSREMYIVHKGKLNAIRKVNEQEQVVGVIKEGEFFGELSLLNGEPRSASVRAIEPAVVLKISPEAFEPLVKKMPELAFSIIKALASRLHQSNEQVVRLQEQDEDIKLLKGLVSKIDSMGEMTAKGIKVPTTIDSIAEEIKAPSDIVERVKTDLHNASNVLSLMDDGSGYIISSFDLFQEFIGFIALRNKML